MDQKNHDTAMGMRISSFVLERVCKRMIEVILLCLPNVFSGTIYAVGPIPYLRVIRVTSGYKNEENNQINWDTMTRSDYDFPGKVWEDYRDRPGDILEAMAWCVEKQKSWTAENPERNGRSVRKQTEGKAGEDYHHMEPVLVKKADLWDEMPSPDTFPQNNLDTPIWQDSPYATVAVVKIHFLPGTVKRGDGSTRIIKELSYSLGTQMLSLHAKEIAVEKQRKLTQERRETYDTIAHEFRNLLPKIGFAYRVLNNEIAHLRESWENLLFQQIPKQARKKDILRQLDQILEKVKAENDLDVIDDILRLSRHQMQLKESCLLPHQNETLLRQQIRPLWSSILFKAKLHPGTRSEIEQLLDRLSSSFQLGRDKELVDKVNIIPAELKAKWVDLAYREIDGRTNGKIKEYIELLENMNLDLPRKKHSLKNFVYLRALIELVPEVEEKLNNCLELLKDSN